MVHWKKQNIVLYLLNFKKRVAHITIHSCGFEMHHKLKMKLPTYSLLSLLYTVSKLHRPRGLYS